MERRQYDDGTSAVPGGVDGPVERVIVVGAGIAGLTTANALAAAGRHVVVLEARNRIGGRLHTADVGGSPVDLGGAWIHTPVGNPLADWADQVGAERRPADFFAHAVPWDPVTGPIDPESMARVEELAGPGFEGARPRAAALTGPDARMSDVIRAYAADLAGTELSGIDRRRLESYLRIMVEQDTGAPPEDVASDGYPAAGVEYGGDYLGDMILGGYRRLTEPLAAGIDVRLNREVVSVGVGPAGVRVGTRRGEVLEGSHALITVPLGVLQGGSIRVDPPLDRRRRDAIGAVGVGRMEKLAIRFARPFWTDSGFPHTFVVPSDRRTVVPALLGLDGFLGEPVLVALGFGSSAPLLGDGAEADATAMVIDLVEAVTGRREQPLAVRRTAWAADPFSRGSYAYPAPGASRLDFDALAEPYMGRILFAGEATNAGRAGFADGAFSSGIREAKRLLRKPVVELVAPAEARG